MTYISSLNSPSIMARASLAQSTDQTAIATERSSTGVALGSAKDDLSTSYAGSTLSAPISWEAQAVKNISDASSLMSATDDAIEQVKNMLQRLRTLAMQAATSSAAAGGADVVRNTGTSEIKLTGNNGKKVPA